MSVEYQSIAVIGIPFNPDSEKENKVKAFDHDFPGV